MKLANIEYFEDPDIQENFKFFHELVKDLKVLSVEDGLSNIKFKFLNEKKYKNAKLLQVVLQRDIMIKFTEQNVKLLESLSATLVGSVKNLNKVVSNDRSYNVKQTNLKVFFAILGILHENASKKSNVMARISDIEIDMDTVQNKMWEAEKDKMKLELELEKGHDYMEELLNKIK